MSSKIQRIVIGAEGMACMNRRYVIISPCRDEAKFLPVTIKSIAQQTVLPAKWVIVDDGSTDETPRILEEAAKQYPYIEVLRREDRGGRSVGPGVIDAFYAGLESIDLDQYDYVCKLDADLEIPDRYFQTVLERFESQPRLGNFSGKVYMREEDGSLTPERMGDENAIGAAKFYRIECFKEIGGFVREVCWDGIDGHLCRMRGWIAQSTDESELRMIHLRQMGSSHKGIWTGRMRWGRGKWFMGSAWYYILVVSAYRMVERPYVIGGLGILCGYIKAAVTGVKRFDDPRSQGFRKHLRRFERRSLLYGKRGTAEAYHRQITQVEPRVA